MAPTQNKRDRYAGKDNFSVKLSPKLFEEIQNFCNSHNMTLTEAYASAVTSFFKNNPNPTARDLRATTRNGDFKTVWLADDLAEMVRECATRNEVPFSAVITTALHDAYQANDGGPSA